MSSILLYHAVQTEDKYFIIKTDGGKRMRRKDREVTDFDKMMEILSACDCCRLGLVDENGAYIVPLNFPVSHDGLIKIGVGAGCFPLGKLMFSIHLKGSGFLCPD